MERYISATKYFQGYRGTLVSGSRGCMYRCKFCYRPFGNEIFYRPIDEVVKEVSWLVKTYNLDYFHLCDELAWSNKERLLICSIYFNRIVSIRIESNNFSKSCFC